MFVIIYLVNYFVSFCRYFAHFTLVRIIYFYLEKRYSLLKFQSPKVTKCATRHTHKFYVLPTQCIRVIFMDIGTNSDYFHN